MDRVRTIVARLPQRELEIRRRCQRDPNFRSACEDYEEAASALRHWQKVAQTEGTTHEAGGKAVEYAKFLDELEAEILGWLNSPGSDGEGS